MRTKIAVPRRMVMESGDFTSKLGRKGGKVVDTRKKQLINLPDDQKAWIMKVVQLAIENGQECNQTAVIRALVGRAMTEDPESFVSKLQQLTIKAKLDDVERRKAALDAEEARLKEALNGNKVAAS